MTVVMGIDPGLAATGLALVHGEGVRVDGFSYGVIETSPFLKLPERLNIIYSNLSSALDRHRPDLMVVEDVFSVQHFPKSGLLLGKVIGAILLAGCRNHVHIIEIPVREAKQALTGSGHAGKKQMEACVRQRLNHSIPITPIHASDALALAMIGLFRHTTAFSP